MNSTSNNPFQIPELRFRLSLYVSVQDAVACVQVCRAWAHDFAFPIWHTIDFDFPMDAGTKKPAVLAKYGHHIRVVKKLRHFADILVILQSGASRIRHLSMTMRASFEFQAHANDLLRQTNASLVSVDLSMEADDEQPKWMLSFDALIPHMVPSKLSQLKLMKIHMTRDAFSALLALCPALETVQLQRTAFNPSSRSKEYQHPEVNYLTADTEQVFRPGVGSLNMSSLLAHFPNLSTWHITPSSNNSTVTAQEMKDGVALWCPFLTAIYIERPASVMVMLLSQVFRRLTSVCVLYKHITSEVILALLGHQGTLKAFSTFIPQTNHYSLEVTPRVEDPLPELSWMLQLIPRLCSRLTSLQLPMHEMNMDEIEQGSWTCLGLKTFKILIRGLDTQKRINSVHRMFDERRHCRGKNLTGASADIDMTQMSLGSPTLEERVTQHLLKFPELRVVWLGAGTWRL